MIIKGDVQYSDQNDGVPSVSLASCTSYCLIFQICRELNSARTTDPIERLQNARGNEETGRNIQDILDFFNYDGDTRAWFWQTCNEFGFYQSSDIGRHAFGSSVPVK